MANHEGRRKSYKWAVFAALTVSIAAILLLNLNHASTFVRKVIPHAAPPAKKLPCPSCDCVTFTSSSNIPDHPVKDPSASTSSWRYEPERDADAYGLSLDQCEAAFPGLFTEIDRQVGARKDRHITAQEMTRDNWPAGTIRALIWDGQLYVLELHGETIRRSRQYSTMLAINRALIATPQRHSIPNIEFVISIEDFTVDPALPVWSYDRKADQNNTWLMPDFGFYAWPEPAVGTYAEVRKRMRDVEEGYPNFSDKIPRLFWRGAIVPAVAPILRQHMVDEVKGQRWADIKVLNWEPPGDEGPLNRVRIEDHCKYQYLINTEGRAWSGRLKYIQNCRSVIVTHKLEWIVPHEYLMVAEGSQQNFIQVERNFSDLNEKMDYYISHPEEAEKIANNSAATFRDRYLTPAAEACYWRKLIFGWAEVSWKPSFYEGMGPDKKWRGVPFDSYVLMRKMHWDPY